jgi:site-specific recombinase XerD
MLLHTFLLYLVCCGADLILVAEVMEHERLGTTRRYSLPSCEDFQGEMEGLHLEHKGYAHADQKQGGSA